MAVKEILLLGDERLYELSRPFKASEQVLAQQVFEDLHDTMTLFRDQHGFGRAIAAPQIGILYRMIYLNTSGPTALINPVLTFSDDEMMELWDDCMSFPGLEVWLKRHKSCTLIYKDLNWRDCVMELEGDLSELIQHEYDHLDGILAVQRAENLKCFRYNTNKLAPADCMKGSPKI